MPAFDTPQAITATVDIIAGDIRLIASDRKDTIVDIGPRDPANDTDVQAAESLRVDFSDGKLTIKSAKRFQNMFTSRPGVVNVTVELPTGSDVRGTTASGDVLCEGRVGQCQLKTTHGDVEVNQAEAVHLSTMHGQVMVLRVAGDSNVVGSGELRIEEIGGKASIKNLNGDSWIGKVAGNVSLNSAHGNISVDKAGSNLTARTAFGNVRVGDVTRGSIVLQSASGDLEVGIHQGTAAWLEVRSSIGVVTNTLEATDRPEGSQETAEIRARTFDGNITIRRAE